MKNIKMYMKKFVTEEEGATTNEYVLLLALIVMAVWLVVSQFGTALHDKFKSITEKFSGVTYKK